MNVATVAAQPKPAMTFQRWMDFLGIPVAVAVFLALYLMPTPSGLSTNARAALAIFLMALVLWVTQAIPVYATALLAMVLLILTGACSRRPPMGRAAKWRASSRSGSRSRSRGSYLAGI